MRRSHRGILRGGVVLARELYPVGLCPSYSSEAAGIRVSPASLMTSANSCIPVEMADQHRRQCPANEIEYRDRNWGEEPVPWRTSSSDETTGAHGRAPRHRHAYLEVG